MYITLEVQYDEIVSSSKLFSLRVLLFFDEIRETATTYNANV